MKPHRTESVSSIRTYQACPMKYDLHYSNMRRNFPASVAMKLGTLVHEAFAYSLQNHCSVKNCLDFLGYSYEEQEVQDKARAIIEYYAPLVGFGGVETPPIIPYIHNGKPMVEYKFEVDVDGVQFLGYIDAVIEDVHGNVVLVDWKTRRSLLATEQLKTDNQLYVYAYVAKEILGIPIDKVCQVQMRTVLPAKPKLLKNGDVSKVLGKTTREVFIETLVGLNVFNDRLEIEDIADEFAPKFVPQSDFLRMSYIDIGQAQKQASEFIDWIKVVRTDTRFLPVNNSRICEWCQYSDLCLDKN